MPFLPENLDRKPLDARLYVNQRGHSFWQKNKCQNEVGDRQEQRTLQKKWFMQVLVKH